MSTVHILSGGAAWGLVSGLQPAFESKHGCNIDGQFGAVGLMRDLLLIDTPCDVLILTQALIDTLTTSGHVKSGSAKPLGLVQTGIAVKKGQAHPAVSDAGGLRAALLAASGIYFPDPLKATAGIHFAKVLGRLGIAEAVQARLRPFPNGAEAMRAMSQAGEDNVIGCTQVTEILYTEGADLVAPLPGGFELATVYTAAISARAREPALAAALIDVLAGNDAASARRNAGFEDC